jgi:serine/threonine protein kinase
MALPPRERIRVRRRLRKSDSPVAAAVLDLLDRVDVEPEFLEPPFEVELASVSDQVGRIIGARWRLGRVVGVGGAAAVYEATDTETGRLAALKLMRGLPADRLDAVRREIAFLRWLRLPGVVQLLDDGTEGDDMFVVMELVDGTPFPGVNRPSSWNTVKPATMALLEIVSGIHASGVIHCDLKPANVLVRPDGSVVVLDLGISEERQSALAPRRALYAGGTPVYAPPEQLRGGTPNPRWDIHAIGVMVAESLQNDRPRNAAQRSRRSNATPPNVRRLIRRWSSPTSSLRPRDACDALRSLVPAKSTAPRIQSWTESELRERFAGPDLLLHLREDAAAELLRRTNGTPAAVEREIQSWVRSGLAREENGLIRVERQALERLALLRESLERSQFSPGNRLKFALAIALRAGSSRDAVRLARRVANRCIDEGRPSAALAALFEGAAAASSANNRRMEATVLCELAAAAIRSGIMAELDRTLLRIQRASCRSETVVVLETAIRAAMHFQAGRPADALREATPHCQFEGDVRATAVAWGVRLAAARTMGALEERRALRQLRFWLRRHPLKDGRRMLASAEGWHAFAGGCFRAAVTAHLRAADAASDPQSELRCILDAAYSAVDCDVDLADSLASQGIVHAARLRNALHEARAIHVNRMALLRRGLSVSADRGFVEAVLRLGTPSLSAMVPLTEAAIAWRRGDAEDARSLAMDAATGWGSAPGAAICRAIAAAAGHAFNDNALRDCRDVATTLLPPPVGMQTLALLSIARPKWKARLRRDFSKLLSKSRDRNPSRIREVLSIRESKTLLFS